MEDQNNHQEPDDKGEVHEGSAVDTGDIIEAIEKTFDKEEQQQQQNEEIRDEDREATEKQQESEVGGKADKSVSVRATPVVVETQEVSTTTGGGVSSSSDRDGLGAAAQSKTNGQRRLSKSRSSTTRRASYQASRNYTSSFQNYGLAYLPYKSNFEPSEDARRRADEFVKALKL